VARNRILRPEDERTLRNYLREIGSEPLLTAAQEVELAKRIRQGDHEALNHLTRANLRFVVSVAKQYVNRGLELGDLINEGNLGLIHAAKRFDETRGFRFISYAIWWIRQRILQAITEQSRVIRLPLNRAGVVNKISRTTSALGQELMREPTTSEIAEHMEISEEEILNTLKVANSPVSLDNSYYSQGSGDPLIDILEDKDQAPVDEACFDKSLTHDIQEALKGLNNREAEILTLYFGIQRDRPLTLEEIGKRMGLTRERVRQIKERAIERLRHASRSRHLKAYLMN
jgi:RNA polymerase primary sigma factor